MAASKYRLMDPMRLLRLMGLGSAKIPWIRALFAIWCSVSPPYSYITEALRCLLSVWTFWSVRPRISLGFFKLNALLYGLRWGPSQGRRTCWRTTKCAPVCHRALSASANRPEQRSLRFMIENIRSMEMNHGVYAGMKSSSTPVESAQCSKARGMFKCYVVQQNEVARRQEQHLQWFYKKVLLY